MKVSIIVPNYNSSANLMHRMDSIFSQTFTDYEIILLDDCSTDNSAELLRRYASRPIVSHFVVNEKNSGSPFSQWERGINLAKGEYVWIAESDDYCEPTFLEECVKVLDGDAEIALCQTGSVVVDANDEPMPTEIWDHPRQENVGKTVVYSAEEMVNKHLRMVNVFYNASGIVFRRDKMFPFPEEAKRFRELGDQIVLLSVAQRGKSAIINKPLNRYRRHQQNALYVPNAAEEIMVLECLIDKGVIARGTLAYAVRCGITQREIRHEAEAEAREQHMQEFYRVSGYRSLFPYYVSSLVRLLNKYVHVWTLPDSIRM